jgi:drug/metabolite transporter (DMT)-like permease
VNLAPLSLTLPYLAFTPVFFIATGYLILGEVVSPLGTVGILFIVAGSYVLNIDRMRRDDLLAPFKAVLSEPGSRRMLGAALLYALCAVLGKRIIQLSDPITATVAFWGVSMPGILAVLLGFGIVTPRELTRKPLAAICVALFMAAHFLTHMIAVVMTKTAYMVSVKRLNGLMGVLYGRFLFGETGLRHRLAGTLLMFAGSLVLTLSE